MAASAEPQVLDVVQLQRIQGLHRGMLYQHLYVVCCLLRAPLAGTAIVRTERDEDVELVAEDGNVLYAQVKIRKGDVKPSHFAEVWSRFDELRAAHRGERSGVPRFALVVNEASPALKALELPDDVMLVSPGAAETALVGTGLVAPCSSLDEMLLQAVRLAEGHRLSVLRPETLVAKLVGMVARAAAGGSPSHFLATDLPGICELFAAQVRPLPVAENYRPQATEPVVYDRLGPLVVAGHPGDGKSAWAAQLAMHAREVAVYVACSSEPGQLLANALVHSIVTTLVARGALRAHELVLPARTGIDALALLDHQIAQRGLDVMTIVDDCQNVRSDALVGAMRAAPSLRWVLLGHPCQALSEVCALNSVEVSTLGGWSDDTLSLLLADGGCLAGPGHVAAVRSVTGASPLFVLHAVRAIASSGGDTASYARSIIAGGNSKLTPQEILLDRAVSSLPPDCGRVASALATAQLSLTFDEWTPVIAAALALSDVAVRRALRTLVALHIVALKQDGLVAPLDVFRPIVEGRFITGAEVRLVREGLAALIHAQLLQERARERILAYIGILTSLGRLSEVADVANAIAEWIRETGIIAEIRAHLEAVLAHRELAAEDAFWTHDTLAFFDIEEGLIDAAEARLPVMAGLAVAMGESVQGALLHKSLHVAIGRKRIAKVRSLGASCAKDAAHSLTIRYAVGCAEAQFGDFSAGVLSLFKVAEGYLARIGITQHQLLGRNIPELLPMLRPDAERIDIQHAADCYDALYKAARSRPHAARSAVMLAIWAAKLYAMAGAERSALIASQEVVDVILRDLDDPEWAREFLEKTVLPAAAQSPLADLAIAVRGQHAVVCAHCGDFEAARQAIAPLTSYLNGLPPTAGAELERQLKLVDDLVARGPLPPHLLAARRARILDQKRVAAGIREELKAQRSNLPQGAPVAGRPNRNDPCPCGSGKKFKKCHGLS